MKDKTTRNQERSLAMFNSPGIELNVWISTKRLVSRIQYDFFLSTEVDSVPSLFQSARVWLIVLAPKSGKSVPTRDRILFSDLTGNGHASEYNNIGAGTLLVNTAINVLKGAYNAETPVYGDVSNAGDPQDADNALQCRARRRHFWSKFNFGFNGGPEDPHRIEARLGELSAVNGPAILGAIPRILQPSDFMEIAPRDF